MGNSHKNHLVWNQQLNQNQTLMEQSLDGPLPKLCLAVALSHQDGRHSAVVLLLKAVLIQVSDYRLLGASGFCSHILQKKWLRSESPIVRRSNSLKVRQSEGSIVRMFDSPKVQQSEGSIVRRLYNPKPKYNYFFNLIFIPTVAR